MLNGNNNNYYLTGRSISAKSCYAVGFLKYRVIIEKCANFDDATEAGHFDSEF